METTQSLKSSLIAFFRMFAGLDFFSKTDDDTGV